VVDQPAPFIERGRAEHEPDSTARFVVTCLDYSRWVVPYEWAAAVARGRGRRLPANFVALYAAGWLTALSLIFTFVPSIASLGTAAQWTLALVPVWCGFEVTRWWLSVLVNRRHNHFVSFERNLVYLFVNLAEVMLAGAVLLRMTSPGHAAEQALFDSFFLTMQLSNAPHASFLHDAAQALTAMASLVLLAGGLAILIGGMGRFFTEGEYEGPWPLPVPKWIDRIRTPSEELPEKEELPQKPQREIPPQL
jgi:hypothetical protein